MTLKNTVGILFGAGAIASGYAQLLAQRGARLVIVSRGKSADELAQQLTTNGYDAVAFHADASDRTAIDNVFAFAKKNYGRIDFIVNGSGGNQKSGTASDLDGFLAMPSSAVQDLMSTNYTAKVLATQAFCAYLKQANHTGSIVNITSMSGIRPLSRVILYSAAFAAVENFSRSAAFIMGSHQLGRINNVAVGFTIGDQNRDLLLNEDGSHTKRGDEIITATAAQRFVEPEEVAHAVSFLLDEEQSGAINGHTLRVDAGFSIIDLPRTGYTKQKN